MGQPHTAVMQQDTHITYDTFLPNTESEANLVSRTDFQFTWTNGLGTSKSQGARKIVGVGGDGQERLLQKRLKRPKDPRQSMNSSWVLDEHKIKPSPKDILGITRENLYEPDSATIRE